MRNALLASAAAATLALAGSALAQSQSQPVTPNQGSSGMSLGQGGQTGTSGLTNQGTSSTIGTSSTATTQKFRSYNEMDDFDGQIADDYDAKDLKDKQVVNNDGDEIGKIEDLAVGDDDRVSQVVLDVSDYVDKDDRYVVVDLNSLHRGEGDADDNEFVLDKSKDELTNMTRFKKNDDRWEPASSS